MKILGIETSCDETAAAVVENGRTLLSASVYTQIARHRPFGGVVPEIASRCHTEVISQIVRDALGQSGVSLSDLAAVAVTAAPGLIGSLLVGVNFAKGLCLSSGLPLVAVHHTRGHIAANYLSNPALKPPFLCLVVSGGHTDLVAVEDYTVLRCLGSTRDDAAGETFDKTARATGLPYPGGVSPDEIAEQGDPNAFSFPKPSVENAPLDFSFSGLKTAVINQIHHFEQLGKELPVADIAASLRRAVVEDLIGHIALAAKETGYRKIAIAGGVSANSLLRREAAAFCRKNGFEFFLPELSLCGDNGAMIAAQGYYEFLAGNVSDQRLNAAPSADLEHPFPAR